jgi:hypothetical protein
MSAQDTVGDDALVSQSQIVRWEREYAALGERIQKIEDRRVIIKTMIDAARALIPAAGATEQAAQKSTPRTSRRSTIRRKRKTGKLRKRAPATRMAVATSEPADSPVTPPQAAGSAVRKRGRRPETGEWKPIIRLIVQTAPAQPVSYSEAKAEILKSELADKFQKSDKGFYNAIARLNKAGEIIAYKGHLFAPDVFRKFQEDLAAGRVRELRMANAAHRSPMGEATLDILSRRKAGAESGHLIWELRKNPEFAAAIDKNKTHPYNVFARLVKTGEVIKRGKRYYYPRSEKEAPSNPESAPISSESRDAAQGSFLG